MFKDILIYMDWLSFAETVLAVLVGGGLLTVIIQQFFNKRQKREEDLAVVKYLALRLAFLFEGYAVDCADKLADHNLADESGAHAGSFIGKVPEIISLPLEGGHKLLDQGLLNDIFDFPQRCIMANRNAMFWEEVVGDRDCCTNALAQNTVDMGARAMDIGKRLREMYKLDFRQLSYGDFDMGKFLEGELTDLKEHKEKLRKRREEKKR